MKDIFVPDMEPIYRAAYESKNPVERKYKTLVQKIIEFERMLNNDEEIGGRLVTAPGEIFHIENISYVLPDVIIFYGKNQQGRPVQLVQDHTQLSVLLTALPKESENPRRIGFGLLKS